MLSEIITNVKKKTPLVHEITNYVTVNDCANIVLAGGGAPIMADDISEVCDITSICSSLVINIGTLNERTIESMFKAGRKANEIGHPVILDPVGAGASGLRNETALKLVEEIKFAVIRGNSSEIRFLATRGGNTQAVDAAAEDMTTEENLESVIKYAQAFSKKTGAVIAITGAVDVIADENKAYVITNGNALMSKVTGTGCMLSALVACYAGANYENILDAAATAVCAMGLAGELAYDKMIKTDGGTGNYRTYIMDYISNMSAEILEEGAKIESK